MNCPKCNGGTYLSEEEVVKVIENVTPVKIMVRGTYVCRACNERFTRVFSEDLEAKRRPDMVPGFQQPPRGEVPGPNPAYTQASASASSDTSEENANKLRFLDNI